MAHPLHHAESSARRYGGVPEDYMAVHAWFDASKAHIALPQHRALRHHAFGIFEAEAVFGPVLVTATGRRVPVRWIGEQHVREDCGRIPSAGDWLRGLDPRPWMVKGALLAHPDPGPAGDPVAAWRAAVAAGATVSGLAGWLAARGDPGGGADAA